MTNDAHDAPRDVVAEARAYVAEYDSVKGNYVIVNRRGGDDYTTAAELLRRLADECETMRNENGALRSLVEVIRGSAVDYANLAQRYVDKVEAWLANAEALRAKVEALPDSPPDAPPREPGRETGGNDRGV
jgi:hypothetical protein